MDLSKIKDLKDLQSLAELMGKFELEEIELEGDGHKIRLRKAGVPVHREILSYPTSMPAGGAPLSAAPQSAFGAPASPGGPAPLPANVREVTSPMVGSFYRSSSPEAEPFVKEGDTVTADQTLCIIEAMKVMNDIPSGVAGVVREILVKNGESVEFGQALFRIEISA